MGYESEEEYQAAANKAAEDEAMARDADGAAAIADNEAKEQGMHDLDLLLSTKAVAIVNIAPEHDEAVTSLFHESLKILNIAENRVIVSAEGMKLATEDISVIAKLQKAIESKRKEYVNPVRQHLDAINDAFKNFTAPLNQADTITREKIKAFNLEREVLERMDIEKPCHIPVVQNAIKQKPTKDLEAILERMKAEGR